MQTEAARPTKLLSIAEAAAMLGVSVRHAYTLARDGEIPVIRFRSRLRVPAGALEEWLAEREREALAAVRSPEMREPGFDRAQGSRRRDVDGKPTEPA